MRGAAGVFYRVTAAGLRMVVSGFPAAFRRRCGAGMLDLYKERLADAVRERGVVVGGIPLFARTALNFLGTGAAEWSARWRSAGDDRGQVDATRKGCIAGLPRDAINAVRSTRRSWRLSLAAVVCIGMGAAASSAVLTLYSSAVLRPLPFPDADRLVRIWLDDPDVGDREPLAYPDLVDLQTQLTTVDRLEATGRSRVMFLGDRGARRVEGEAITPGYFDLLDVQPFLGRLFLPEEYLAGSEPVMVLSYGTWNAWYGADPDIVGSIVRTSNRDYTVVGVLPRGFIGTIEDDIPDLEFWVPMIHDRSPSDFTRRDFGYIWTVGRLGPGASLERVTEEARTIGARVAQANPETRGPMTFAAERLGENWREEFRRRNYLLLGAATMLLLVAASNVAGLLVARSLGQRREFAVRAALGAGRATLVRQVLTETALLAAVGGALGVLAGRPLLRLFLALAPEEVPGYIAVTPNLIMVALVSGVLVVTAFLAGIIPALVTSRVDPMETLRGSGRGTTQGRERRLGEWLVTTEMALTTVLVVTAGLLLRSYQALGESDLGYRTDRMLRMAIFVDQRDVAQPDLLHAFRQLVHDRLTTYPGVENVGLVWPTVPPGTGGDTRLAFPGMPDAYREHGLPVHLHAVDPHFLPTMDVPIIAGRGIADTDVPNGQRVVVVSEGLAELMGGPETALGQTIEETGRAYRVVGVVRDVMFFGPINRRARNYDVYVPISQETTRLISIAIATAGDPAGFIRPLSDRLNTLAPSSALDWVSPLTQEIGDHFDGRRFYLLLLGAFASSALALTAVGLFAVLANFVSRQRAEFGVRVALGADGRRIVGEVMQRGARLAAIGLAAGAAGATLVGRVLRGSLHGVGAFDPVTFAVTATIIALVVGAASYWPARKAAGSDPVLAMRSE